MADLPVQISAGALPTYSAVTLALSLATSATDVVTLSGSATTTVRVLRVRIMGTKTTAGQELIALLRRSTANTGGTSTTITAALHDTNSSVATAVFRTYTVNPTALGTGNGFYRIERTFWPALSSVVSPSVLEWEFDGLDEQNIVLRGTSDFLAINMQSGSVAGDTLYASIEWTEA
jgi:hypothetical protein